MSQLTFEGTVFSGKGEGKKFIDLPWVKRQIQEKLGFTPYSGTLNIRLTQESTRNKAILKNAKAIRICPEKGYCTGILIKAKMGDLPCCIILPQIPNYPQDVLEIISPYNLREKQRMEDGARVSVTASM